MVEDLGNRSKRLIELGGHLDKVARHAGTAQTVVLTIGKNAMKRMAELMEHGGHLVPGDQRGLTLWCLGAVANIEDDRQLVPLATLLLETVHPGSTTLRRTTVIVAIEECKALAVIVDHLIGLHVGMIGWDVCALLEREAIHAAGRIEHTVEKYAIDREIGLHFVVGDIQHLLLHLGRIVEAVIGLEFEVGTLGLAGIVLDGLRLGIGLRTVGLDQVLQEGIDIIGCLGHRVLQRI